MTQLRTLDSEGRLRGIGLDDLYASYGSYVPGPSTTGPRWSGPFVQVNPASPDGPINISDAWLVGQGITRELGLAFIEGREFWGRVVIQTTGVVFLSSVFHGANPAYVSQSRACIQSSGANPPHWVAYDCLIDPGVWPNFGTAQDGWGNCHINGISGSNYELYRTEIRNCQDAITFVGPTGSLEIAQAASTLIAGCWFHKGYYMNPWEVANGGPSDLQPHSDGIQMHTGKNLTVKGCLIGGARVKDGYATWPGGVNAGDDFWNSAVMMKQEVSGDDIRKIENVLFEDNWLAGGVMTTNWAYVASRPNHWDSFLFRRNQFMLRGADWGNWSPGGPQGAGFYANLTQSDNYGQMYENTIWETGAPVPGANR